jgi:protein kinase X
MDKNAKDLIQRLLIKDKMKRLGNLKDGIEDIKNHKWFEGVNWKEVELKKTYPPIPVRILNKYDTKCFITYSEKLTLE